MTPRETLFHPRHAKIHDNKKYHLSRSRSRVRPFGSRPIVWQNDAAHTAIALPFLPGDNYGDAQLINSSGTIVGWSAVSEPGTWNVGPSRIVLWSGGVPYELQSLLAPSSADWTINNVMSINNRGQMAALATRNGVMRAVVLNPL